MKQLFVIIGHDVADSLNLRQKNRPAHLARLQALLESDRLIIAGPCPLTEITEGQAPKGFSGSVIIAEFPSLAAAQTWADEDPYLSAGVYASVTVRPFIKALP